MQDFRTRKCTWCGKKFVLYSQNWVYRIATGKRKYFCGWGCYHAYQAQHEKRKELQYE